MDKTDHIDSEASLQAWRDLGRLRAELEVFALSVCRRDHRFNEIEATLRTHLQRLRQHAASGDYLLFHRADSEFHSAMVEAANLEALSQAWQICAGQLDAWILGVKEQYWPNLMALYREHELLLEVWMGDDEQAAADSCRQHIEAGWQRTAASARNPAFDVDPVERAISFFCTHFARRVKIEWVAQHVCHTSTSNLHRLFKARQGTTPYAYLKQIRLERAAQLLRSTHDSIATIAKRVGYRNPSHFAHDFREHFGVAPGSRRGAGSV
jgi:AraC-like DNA-binding protein